MTNDELLTKNMELAGVITDLLLGDCSLIAGKPTTAIPLLKPEYATSDPQVYSPLLGTLGRTGLCVRCNAAIYQRESISGRFPNNLVGPKYHAIEGGLREMEAAK